jgi:predicted negative regulator of RcsB-dependent stress response
MGDSDNSVERYREALAKIALSLDALDRTKSPVFWARAASVRGDILLAIGTASGDRASLQQAREAYVAARDVFRAANSASDYESYFAKKLAAIDDALSRSN